MRVKKPQLLPFPPYNQLPAEILRRHSYAVSLTEVVFTHQPSSRDINIERWLANQPAWPTVRNSSEQYFPRHYLWTDPRISKVLPSNDFLIFLYETQVKIYVLDILGSKELVIPQPGEHSITRNGIKSTRPFGEKFYQQLSSLLIPTLDLKGSSLDEKLGKHALKPHSLTKSTVCLLDHDESRELKSQLGSSELSEHPQILTYNLNDFRELSATEFDEFLAARTSRAKKLPIEILIYHSFVLAQSHLEKLFKNCEVRSLAINTTLANQFFRFFQKNRHYLAKVQTINFWNLQTSNTYWVNLINYCHLPQSVRLHGFPSFTLSKDQTDFTWATKIKFLDLGGVIIPGDIQFPQLVSSITEYQTTSAWKQSRSPYLEKIELYHPTLNALVDAAKNCKQLVVNYKDFQEEKETPWRPECIDNLLELEIRLDFGEFSAKTLLTILSCFPKLQKLKIIGNLHTIKREHLKGFALKFPDLRILELVNPDTSEKDEEFFIDSLLTAIITTSPDLEILRVEKCAVELISPENVSLTKLRVLDLDSIKFGQDFVLSLFSHSQELTEIRLKNVGGREGEFFDEIHYEPFTLPKIKKVQIESVAYPFISQELIRSAVQAEQLIFSGSNPGTRSKISFEKLEYRPNLTYLKLKYIEMSYADLAKLLNHCPALEKLEIEDCKFSDEQNIPPFRCPALKQATLEDLHESFLSELLHASPHLTTMRYSNYLWPSKRSVRKTKCYALQALEFTAVTDTAALYNLLNAAPNLASLKLRYQTRSFNMPISLRLTKLETLDFDGLLNFYPQEYQYVLQANPKVRYLKVDLNYYAVKLDPGFIFTDLVALNISHQNKYQDNCLPEDEAKAEIACDLIKRAPTVKRLTISLPNVDGKDLKTHFSSLPTVEELIINSQAPFHWVTLCPQLKILHVNHNLLGDLPSIQSFLLLRELSFKVNELNVDYLFLILKNAPNLEYLCLDLPSGSTDSESKERLTKLFFKVLLNDLVTKHPKPFLKRLKIHGSIQECQEIETLREYFPQMVVTTTNSSNEIVELEAESKIQPSTTSKKIKLHNKARVADTDIRPNPSQVFQMTQHILPNKAKYPVPNYYHIDIYTDLIYNPQNGKLVWLQPKVERDDPNLVPLEVDFSENVHALYRKKYDDKNHHYHQSKIFLLPGVLTSLPAATTTDAILHCGIKGLKFYRYPPTAQNYVLLEEGHPEEIKQLIIPLITQTDRNDFADPTIMDLKDAENLIKKMTLTFNSKTQKFEYVRPDILKNHDPQLLFKAARTIAKSFEEPKTETAKAIQLPQNGLEFLEALRLGVEFIDDDGKKKFARFGSCRHCVQFAKAHADACGIPCQVSFNDCHAFFKFERENFFGKKYWQCECLGGYTSGKENIIKMEISTEEKDGKKFSAASTGFFSSFLTPATPQPIPTKTVTTATPDPIPTRTKIPFATFYKELNQKLETKDQNHQSHLFYCSDQPATDLFISSIMEQTIHAGHECIFLRDLSEIGTDDLHIDNGKLEVDKANWVKLLKGAKKGSVLLINDTKQSFRLFNALDDTRELMGVKIPDGVKIIVVCNRELCKVSSSPSRDNRFAFVKADCIDTQVELRADPLITCFVYDKKEQPLLSIELDDEDEWKSDLIGKPVCTDKGVEFKLGALAKLLIAPSSEEKKFQGIRINKPQDPDFDLFLREMLIRKKIVINGKEYPLPADFKVILTKTDYQPSDSSFSEILTDEAKSSGEFILNSSEYSHFLHGRCFDEKAPLPVTVDGILALHAGRTITVRITEDLKPGKLRRLKACAKKHNVTLLKKTLPPPEVKILNEDNIKSLTDPLTIVCHTETSTTATLIAEQLKADYLVHFSKDQDFANLFEYVEQIPGDKDSLPRFRNRVGDLTNFLIDPKNKDKYVVICGAISSEFARRLETLTAEKPYLWLNGKYTPVFGRLVVVTDPQENDLGMMTTYAFEPKPPSPKVLDEKEKSPRVPPPEKKEHKELIDEKRERLQALHETLEKQSVVICYGPEVSGKTKLMKEEYEDYHQEKTKKPAKVIHGLNNIDEWAQKAQTDKETQYVLFIDKVKDAQVIFDRFQGATNRFQSNVLGEKGKIYPWQPNMKVVCATHRDQAIFTDQPQLKVEFPPYTPVYIRDFVLKPLLTKLLKDIPDIKPEIFDKIIDKFFAAACFVPKPHLVTIRQYNQMCLQLYQCLTARKQHFNAANIEFAAAFVADDVLQGLMAKSVLPEMHAKLFTNEIKKYQQITKILNEETAEKIKTMAAQSRVKLPSFIFMPSRYRSLRLLLDQLAITDFRHTHKEYANHGMRGFLLEGPTSAGKTLMTTYLLEVLGYRNGDDPQTPTQHPANKLYFVVDATNPDALKKHLSMGSLVLINEINTAECEDIEGDIIATQNSASAHEDRHELSPEFLNLFQFDQVDDYLKTECVEILKQRGYHSSVIDTVMLWAGVRKDTLSLREAERQAKELDLKLKPTTPQITVGGL